MEEQGAMARQANAAAGGIIDDENSQAEGSNVEGAVGYSRSDAHINLNNNGNSNASQQQQQQQQNHPHYENIYESLEQYNTAAVAAAAAGAGVNAVAPADALPQSQADANVNLPNINNLNNSNNNTNSNNQSRILPNISYRNDLYDRTNTTSPAYDVPRAVRSGLGFRRNFHIDLQGANRFNASRAGASNTAPTSVYGSNNNCQRQRSFDDTESQNYYNFNYQPSLRYENIYEQIRDEPIYRNTGSGARVYGRLDVIGHGIGRIERHLSSSCGNIDHYNLGGHYAVLGHSHFGTVGHIRLNTSASVTNAPIINSGCSMNPAVTNTTASTATNVTTTSSSQRDANNVKNSASSFFSCLQGENAQSMSNIYRASIGIGSSMATTYTTAGGQQIPTQFNCPVLPNNIKEREPRSASAGPLSISINNGNANDGPTTSSGTRQTGAIPKIKALALNSNKPSTSSSNNTNNIATEKTVSIKNAITKKATNNTNTSTPATSAKTSTTSPEHTANSSTLNRISKSSLQWLLVNKWLPLWIGQGPECKVIDFNFMFSRDCSGCDAASAATHMSNPYYTPRLGGMMPHDLMRFSAANAEMHAPCAAASTALRRDLNMRPRALNRLREYEQNRREVATNRYEDPSYENVHVHWQNGFEFGRSREYDHNYQNATGTTRPQLQRARSESPNFNTQQRRMRQNYNATQSGNNVAPAAGYSTTKYVDIFKNYVLNAENNTFKPKLVKSENSDVLNCSASGSGNVSGVAEVIINPLRDKSDENETAPNVAELEAEMDEAVANINNEMAACSANANISDNEGEQPTSSNRVANVTGRENVFINDNETDATKTKATNDSNNINVKSTNKEQNDD
uniref:Ring canal kelch protein n=3 Tax=Bactrocera latifrons TaxID=174628 RepID=A0A0K8UMG6_BACLA